MKLTTIFKLCLVMALGAALTACQTPAPSPAGTPSKTDLQVAEVSQKLAKQCFAVGLAIAGAKAFIHEPTVLTVLAIAEPAQQRFCAAPPADVQGAIGQLTQLLLDINNAVNRVQ